MLRGACMDLFPVCPTTCVQVTVDIRDRCWLLVCSSMVYREDQKLEVQQATDIVRLIGEDVALRPKGREFLGLCPFHDDKRPSFHVSPVKQIYKCFSCGAGGDVFSFAMMHHKMTFPEALAHLAERAGIVLNRASGGDRSQSDGGLSERQAIVHANEVALKFFRSQLGHSDIGRTARQYLKQRGISDEMSELFQIGYAPGPMGWVGWRDWPAPIGSGHL